MNLQTRDQNRALHAYQRVGKAREGMHWENYKVAFNGLGANVMRSGLAAAMAFLERQKEDEAIRTALQDLSDARIPGFEGEGRGLPERVRKMTPEAYMLATRELLRVTLWFRRAIQAQGK